MIFNAILSDGGRSDVEKYDLLNNHLIHLYEFYFDKFDKPKIASNEIEIENDRTKRINETEIEAFHLLREADDIEEFKSYLNENKEEIRIDIGYEGSTLLLESIKMEKKEFVEYLIEKGASLSETDIYGRNGLELAFLTNEREEIINMIKDDYENRNDVLRVVIDKDMTKLRRIDLNAKDDCGCTILHYIAARNQIDFLEYLLKERETELRSCDFKSKDKEGLSCIERAASNGHLEMLSKLIETFNIQMSYQDEFSLSILECILRNSSNLELLEWWFHNAPSNLPDGFVDENKLMFKINGKTSGIIIDKIEYLVSKRGSVNVRDENGNTLLMHLMNTHKYMDKQLFDYLVADVVLDTKNKYEQDISHVAAKVGNYKILRELMLPLESYDSFNYTPMMYAVKYGHIETVKWFIENFNVKKIKETLLK